MTAVADLFSLAGRTAIVTGGGTGLGRQFALALAEAGADVMVAGRRLPPCESAAARIEALGRRALARSVDVRHEGDVRAMVDAALERFGGIDILVNNAAINRRNPVVSQPRAEWQEVVDTDVTGVFLCCQAVGPHMIARRRGRIVNVASVYGTVGRDGRLYVDAGADPVESLPYATSKGAVLALTRDLAVNWGRYGITVNAISPGMFGQLDAEGRREPLPHEARFADRTPLGRLGEADDVKGAAVFLASDAGRFVTGHDLVVDGGWTAW